ncbi:MAG: sigma-70 family RNA polymerase sigma factor [Chloroflexota bacterium]
MVDIPDGVLAVRARRGEAEAYGELVRRYQAAVFNVCYRLLGERGEAEDMAQETLWRAYQRLDTFNESRPFGPWVRRVAANLCLNRLQRIDRETDLPDDETGFPAAPLRLAEDRIERREAAERVRQALLSLSPRARLVIELRHFEALSYEEIAADLAMTLSEVRTLLYRARRTLARRLSIDG